MKLASFKSEIKKLDQNFLQSILDGSALMMEKDEALNLGSSNGAFVIFWIEDEDFSSVEKLRDYLMIEAEDLLTNYYEHSPLSREYFEKKFSELIDFNFDFLNFCYYSKSRLLPAAGFKPRPAIHITCARY